MLFNSYEFILIFLPVIFFGYFFLISKRILIGSKVWLVGGSLFFYSYWNIRYLPLILVSIFVNFLIGSSFNKNLKIEKNILLKYGIIFNFGLLGYFKYRNFFLENFNSIIDTNIPLQNIVLPLGISFFTFTQVAYLVDSYKDKAKEYDLLNYMLFVTFFPHLIAGPILHHKDMMPQFASKRNLVKNYRNIAHGLFIFAIGLFKKVVIADTFAIWAVNGFDNAKVLTLFEAWATSLSYTFQLYFDFSGYTDMAIGTALLFNIRFPINFNSPYKALNIQDFWKRWHITLSSFLKDYLYIPLGGNKGGKCRNYLNLYIVFLIGGLWHGASWMFIIWGALHGIAMVIHRIWLDFGFRMYSWLAWMITFNFINITWVFFRAKDMDSAEKLIKGMFGVGGISLHEKLETRLGFLREYGITFNGWSAVFEVKKFFIFFLLVSIVLSLKNSNQQVNEFKPNKIYSIWLLSYLIYSIFSLNKLSEFLYFQF